jgi:tetratricopeptide (TPR) repeat protein
MSRSVGIVAVSMLLVLFSMAHPEEKTLRDGASPDEIEALREHAKGTESLLSKRYDEAISYFKKAIELNQKFTEAYYNLGIAYEELGRYKDSMGVLKEAVQLDPTHANAYYALGYAYYQLKDYGDAVEALKQSIALKPDNAFAHRRLGSAYLKMGNRKAAIEHYEILKTLNSTLAGELYREIAKADKK